MTSGSKVRLHGVSRELQFTFVRRKAVNVILVDFSKAFDAVPNSLLLDKLPNCGRKRFTLHWVMNWLNSRAQRVVVNGLHLAVCQSPAVLPRAQL